MSEGTTKPSELIAVTEWLEIIKFFDEGAKAKADLTVWTKESGSVANCNVISLSQAEKMIVTTSLIGIDKKRMVQNLIETGNRCFFNMRLERATVFFASKLQSNTVSNFQIALPEKVFKVQRRQKQRFKISLSYVLRVTFNVAAAPRKTFKQKIYDISSTGLSFLATPEEATVFEKSEILINVRFIIRTHEFNLKAKIIHCKHFLEKTQEQNDHRFKIGVMFLDIKKDAAIIIDDYVFEENRRFYTRFL